MSNARIITASTIAALALTVSPWAWLPFCTLLVCTAIERVVLGRPACDDE